MMMMMMLLMDVRCRWHCWAEVSTSIWTVALFAGDGGTLFTAGPSPRTHRQDWSSHRLLAIVAAAHSLSARNTPPATALPLSPIYTLRPPSSFL